jgi:L-fuculose-phosphate aldolase
LRLENTENTDTKTRKGANAASKLVQCVRELYGLGLTSSISGNHSIRFGKDLMLITPTGIPRYNLKASDLVRINLQTGDVYGNSKPTIEWQMHRDIYRKTNASAVVHTHSPFTLGVAISSNFRHVIEEAKFVVGNPVIIKNLPSGSAKLAQEVSSIFGSSKTKAVIIRNHGVVAVGGDIDEARAIVESLEEWAKILTVAKIFGGAKHHL